MHFFRQWLPRNKLERFSLSKERDQSKLLESRKPQTRKAVQRAFDHAMNYKQQVRYYNIINFK